jgi:hypothetical protein
MKNFTLVLLSAVVLGSLSSAVAQTFTLSNITPVSVSSDPWTPVESHVAISNTSNSLKRVRIERIINYIQSGQFEFFCYGATTGLCYPPGTAMSNGQDTIFGNSVDNSFKASLNPTGVYGPASIHYRIFDTDNISDSVGVVLAWDITTSLGENNEVYGLSKPLQNPADAFTVFNYNLKSTDNSDRLIVFNMLGTKIKTMDIPGKSGALVLTTSDLKSGMYMVSYISNGKVKDTSRLVVNHR